MLSLFCILHRPPDNAKHLHKYSQEKLDEMIEINVNNNIVIGDINCGYIKNNIHSEMKSIFTRNGLKKIIKKPTRIQKGCVLVLILEQQAMKTNEILESMIIKRTRKTL